MSSRLYRAPADGKDLFKRSFDNPASRCPCGTMFRLDASSGDCKVTAYFDSWDSADKARHQWWDAGWDVKISPPQNFTLHRHPMAASL